MTIAYCGGTFDLLHPGHVRFLKWVREHFDVVIVALNTDEFIVQYKGKPPVQKYSERAEMLYACRYVDLVVENIGGKDSKPSILKVRPTHIINGSDYTVESLKRQMDLSDDFLWENDLKIVLCDLPREYSTTELKERVKQA